jgi:hypothetical protein
MWVRFARFGGIFSGGGFWELSDGCDHVSRWVVVGRDWFAYTCLCSVSTARFAC